MLALEKITHLFCWILGQTIFKFFFNFKVEGRGNIKNLKGPLIVVFNHSSWLDAFFVNAAISPISKIAPVHYATWCGHYMKFRPFLAMAGAFPVKKGIGLENSLKRAMEILQKGGVVGIAPEERRRRLGRKRKGRRGAAFLAIKMSSPVLPIYIDGSLGVTISDFILRKRRVTVRIGEPFFLEPQSVREVDELNNLSAFVANEIYKLKGAE